MYQVVSSERRIKDAEITKLKDLKTSLESKNILLSSKITQLESKISSLTANLTQLESTNSTLSFNSGKLTSELQTSKTELTTNQQTISSLQSQLAILSDSLAYMRSEFMKPKPAPRQVVSITSTDQVSFKGNNATVNIGYQVWMVENLNTARFLNGDPIIEAKTDWEWENAGYNGQPAWCYYDNKPANGVKYGKLYNCYAVNDSRGLAPAGFQIPSDEEWTELIDDLRYVSAGKKMKTSTGWKYGVNGNNSSGFAGLPGGCLSDVGTFFNIGGYGHWWSSSGDESGSAWIRILNYDSGTPYQHASEKNSGFSARCLRD